MSTATPPPRVDQLLLRRLVTIRPDASLRAAARLMCVEDVSAVVVGEPGGLVSVLTERDVATAVAADIVPATAVAALATSEPATVDRDTSVVTAAATMLRLGVRHLVVVDGVQAVGMVSMRDVVGALLPAVVRQGRLAPST